MIKYNIEQGSEAWHDIRTGKFTASIFSDVVAGESTDTYKKLIISIAGQIISGISEPTYSNADMERGIELEPFAAIQYEEIMQGLDVVKCGFISPDDELLSKWVGVSPDRLVGDDGGLEIKCPRMVTHLNYIKANRLPNEYKWQVQGSLFVTGLDWWDFMSFYPNMKPFLIRVYPDLEMHDTLDKRLRKAIEDVQKEIEIYNQYTHD